MSNVQFQFVTKLITDYNILTLVTAYNIYNREKGEKKKSHAFQCRGKSIKWYLPTEKNWLNHFQWLSFWQIKILTLFF